MKKNKKKQLGLALKFLPVALLVVGLGIGVVVVRANAQETSDEETLIPPTDLLPGTKTTEATAAQVSLPPGPVNKPQTNCVVTATLSWEKAKDKSTSSYIIWLREGKASDPWNCDADNSCFYKKIDHV